MGPGRPLLRSETNQFMLVDESGFRYNVILPKSVDVFDWSSRVSGHYDKKIIEVTSVLSDMKGMVFPFTLYDIDDSWEKRVIGRLVVVREHIHFDWQELRDTLEVTRQVIFEGTRAEARIAEKSHHDDFFKDCTTGAEIFARGMSDPFKYRFDEMQILPEAPR